MAIRFLLRALAFVAIGTVLAAAAGRVSRQYPPTALVERNLERIENVAARADSVEILLLGNSHIGALDYAQLDGTVERLGLAWNDLFEVEHQVRVLLPQLPRLRTAYISISYTSFHWDNAIGNHERYVDSRRLFYAEYPMGGWIRGDFRNYAVARAYWLARYDHWYRVVAGLRHGSDDEDMVDLHVATAEELEAHAEERAAQFLESADDMVRTRPRLPHAAYAALSRTVRRLQRQGVEVVLLTPPYHESYSRRLADSSYPDLMHSLASRFAEEHGVTWVDAAGHDAFAHRADLYRDSDHFNIHGRREFTRWMLDGPLAGQGQGRTAPGSVADAASRASDSP
jgi:hypothetical protein